jgi:CMP-N-acetylneuraminic acid synthetase
MRGAPVSGSIVAGIFARGGSKGVPRKNLREVAGHSLLERAILAARSVPRIERVFVSTDDDEIATASVQLGAEVPFRRPPALATDGAPEWLAWRHAIEALTDEPGADPIEILVVIPTTAPLRLPEDVAACLEKLLTSTSDMVITVTPAQRNPYFNMVEIDEEGIVRLAIPGAGVVTRQSAPAVFDITTVAYAVRAEFVRQHDSWDDGRVEAVVVPAERALDIDSELDLRIAECLLRTR